MLGEKIRLFHEYITMNSGSLLYLRTWGVGEKRRGKGRMEGRMRKGKEGRKMIIIVEILLIFSCVMVLCCIISVCSSSSSSNSSKSNSSNDHNNNNNNNNNSTEEHFFSSFLYKAFPCSQMIFMYICIQLVYYLFIT